MDIQQPSSNPVRVDGTSPQAMPAVDVVAENSLALRFVTSVGAFSLFTWFIGLILFIYFGAYQTQQSGFGAGFDTLWVWLLGFMLTVVVGAITTNRWLIRYPKDRLPRNIGRAFLYLVVTWVSYYFLASWLLSYDFQIQHVARAVILGLIATAYLPVLTSTFPQQSSSFWGLRIVMVLSIAAVANFLSPSLFGGPMGLKVVNQSLMPFPPLTVVNQVVLSSGIHNDFKNGNFEGLVGSNAITLQSLTHAVEWYQRVLKQQGWNIDYIGGTPGWSNDIVQIVSATSENHTLSVRIQADLPNLWFVHIDTVLR